jgi:hypothetical protein
MTMKLMVRISVRGMDAAVFHPTNLGPELCFNVSWGDLPQRKPSPQFLALVEFLLLVDYCRDFMRWQYRATKRNIQVYANPQVWRFFQFLNAILTCRLIDHQRGAGHNALATRHENTLGNFHAQA